MNLAELTGKASSHVTQLTQPRCALHQEVVRPFLAMREAAAEDGILIRPFSAWRSFDAQVKIWNRKRRGERPLFDENGVELDASRLTLDEKIHRVLQWSALPGASRHHWGTEVDVVDEKTMADGYRAKLLPEETLEGGAFYKLHRWLDRNAASFGFFRPYDRYRGGMCAESWHLSFAPISRGLPALMSPVIVRGALLEAKIEAKERIMELLPMLFEQFVCPINPE